MLDGRRVVFLQPYVPRYRAPLFAALRERLAVRGAEMLVAVDSVDSSRHDGSSHEVDLVLGSRLQGHLRWRRLADAALTASDLVVVEQAIKNLETAQLAWLMGSRRPGLAFWGHGRFAGQSPIVDWLKQKTTQRGDWFFAYTQRGAEWVVKKGFPRGQVTVLRNTLDAEALAENLCGVTARELSEFRSEFSLGRGPCALFMGGVDESKDVRFLLDVAKCAEALDPNFRLLIAGDGPGVRDLRATVSGLGCVRLLGSVDGRRKALALVSCQAMAIPRRIGLVAVDALVVGRPIVSLPGGVHGPESDYLGPEGLLVESEDTDPSGFARVLMNVSKAQHDSARVDQREVRRRGAEWSVGGMADRFVMGIERWAQLRPYLPG